MKAMILIAGSGTRLRPLTNSIPKCMVPISGKPVLLHTIEWCRDFGIEEFVLNPCHLPEVVTAYFGDGRRFGVHIQYSPEERALGTAGAVKRAARHFDGPFLVWYGDNLSRCDIARLRESHVAKGGLATMALHHREDVSQSGIVGLDADARITRFLEKPSPEEVFSHWVNAGIYILETAVLDAIPGDVPSDFGREVFPRLLDQGAPLFGYRLADPEGLWWLDRPEDLLRLQADPRWAARPPMGVGDR
jgi:NDP-sugar pyrophosphorylase family protein